MSNPTALQKSMTRAQALDRGRQSLRERAWSTAFSELSAADHEAPIEPVTLASLA